MTRKENSAAERAMELFDIICQIEGDDCRLDDLVQSRRPPYPTLRAIVMERMTKEGYTQAETGRAIGKDHATVNTMLKRLQELRQYPTQSDMRYLRVMDELDRALAPKEEQDDRVVPMHKLKQILHALFGKDSNKLIKAIEVRL